MIFLDLPMSCFPAEFQFTHAASSIHSVFKLLCIATSAALDVVCQATDW